LTFPNVAIKIIAIWLKINVLGGNAYNTIFEIEESFVFGISQEIKRFVESKSS
jgi:hypothetical protein